MSPDSTTRVPAAAPGCRVRWGGDAAWDELPIPPGLAAFDHFGVSVALADHHLLVGADGDDRLGQDAGAAYLYERDVDGAWSAPLALVAGDGAAEDHLGWTVDIDGDVAVIAAPGRARDGHAEAGVVIVFERGPDASGHDGWHETAVLTAPVARTGARFGEALRVRGDLILVGAPWDDGPGRDAGMAYLFERVHGAWSLATSFAPAAPMSNAHFGSAVALGDGDLAIGAEGQGAAYLYTRHVAVWWPVARLTPSDTGPKARFGASLDLSGDDLLVGAEDQVVDGLAGAGGVWAFARVAGASEPGGWQARGRLPTIAGTRSHFGTAIRIDGSQAVIGAWGAPRDGAPPTGATFVYAHIKGQWLLQAGLAPPDVRADDRLGLGVALAGTTLVAGAWGDDTPGRDAGRVVVFDAPDRAGR
ncbi:MAG: hypothetical protein U1F43_30400 [Myxococcota bacterium]